MQFAAVVLSRLLIGVERCATDAAVDVSMTTTFDDFNVTVISSASRHSLVFTCLTLHTHICIILNQYAQISISMSGLSRHHDTIYKFYYYRQACALRSHAGIVFTQWSKNRFFAPQGRHIAPINVKFIGTGDCGPLPRDKVHVYRGKNVGIQPPKL